MPVDGDGIFLLNGNKLEVVHQQPYESEDVLQKALADHPEVLAGPTTAGDGEAKLLLVRREMAVPVEAGGVATFSLDHLFLDADGVPVVVEVKRSSDTRIRREVVGQMLDYAANGVKYWPIAALRAAVDAEAAASRVGGSGAEPVSSESLIAGLREGLDPEDFWKAVESNLAAGRIRMLFVTDELPDELVRIIEFLNEQMSPAEVLGVELRQYVGQGQTVLVPRVVGRTTAAVVAKSPNGGQRWNRESLLEAAKARRPGAEYRLIERLIHDADQRGAKLGWGRGISPGVSGWYYVEGQATPVWNLNVNDESPSARAYIYFYLGDIATRVGVAAVERAAASLEDINVLRSKIQEARAHSWNKWPSAYLDDLLKESGAVETMFRAIGSLRSGEPLTSQPT